MTTNSEMLDELCGLVNRTASETRTRLLKRLNQTIKTNERLPVKPWFLETRVTGSLTVGQGYLDLPSDFLEEYEDGNLRIQLADGSWTPDIDKLEFEKLEAVGDNLADALPQAYSLFGSRFYLRPIPDIAYVYKFKYYARTTAVVENDDEISNPWLVEFYDFTLYSAAHAAARTFLRAPEIARDLKPMLDIEKDAFWRAVESRMNVNMDPLLGDRED